MHEREEAEQNELRKLVEATSSAMRRAVNDAVRQHKLLGNPICVWEDGRVVWIPPEEIVIPGEEDAAGRKQ